MNASERDLRQATFTPLLGRHRRVLRKAGVAAPIDSEILYYVLIGAASLPYVNAPEVRLLTGRDPSSATWIRAHADGLVAILLPGLAAG
ncbi:hypothetical protein [Mycobacterium avium]|uniref:hypothetical protein n=1 Tax=Mycobacterium avium TaxID=1764 RepID=UPI000B1E60FE|nr:hypothetical protein [Mycobacterium avium]